MNIEEREGPIGEFRPPHPELEGLEWRWTGGTWEASLTRCPFCGDDFEGTRQSTHFLNEHGPEVIPSK